MELNMKKVDIGLTLAVSFSAFAAPSELTYLKYLTCIGKDIKATIYQNEMSDSQGLIILEKIKESPQYATTKSF